MITVAEDPTGTAVRVDGWLAGDGVGAPAIREIYSLLRQIHLLEDVILLHISSGRFAGRAIVRQRLADGRRR